MDKVILPKIIKVRNLLKALKKLGFVEIEGTKHHKLKDNRNRIATITRSWDELPRSMVNFILRGEINLSEEEIKSIVDLL